MMPLVGVCWLQSLRSPNAHNFPRDLGNFCVCSRSEADQLPVGLPGWF